MKIINNISRLYSRRKELRNNSTQQEIMLWIRLKNSQLGYKFRRQHSIGGYIVDFYCPIRKLVIEIDGSQHYEKNAVEYDAVRSNYLEGLNLKILRFSNGDINANIEGVLMKIRSEL